MAASSKPCVPAWLVNPTPVGNYSIFSVVGKFPYPFPEGRRYRRLVLALCIMSCSFAEFASGSCGANPNAPAEGEKIIPLNNCSKDISNHLSLFQIPNTVQTEHDLILARVGLFAHPDYVSDMTICPKHRGAFGLSWRCGTQKCKMPVQLSNHRRWGARPKGDRGIGFFQSKKVYELAGELVPVGSVICRNCRTAIGGEEDLKGEAIPQQSEIGEHEPVPSTSGLDESRLEQLTLETVPQESEAGEQGQVPGTSGLEESLQQMTLEETHGSLSSSTSAGGAERSLYTVESHTSSGDAGSTAPEPKALLGQLLYASGSKVEKVKVLSVPWAEASQRTQRFHLQQASDAVSSVLQVLAPDDSYSLWKSLRDSRLADVALGVGANVIEMEILTALVECYNCANQSFTRRQILSIMADKYSFSELEKLMPGLTRYQVTAAKKHMYQHGRGAPLPPSPDVRMRVDPGKLDHFISFITSAHVVQDLPFGEKTLKLSSGETLKVPNTIRAMIPERIVSQYQQYCAETHVVPMGKRTLLRVLSACSASVRTSLQGLDYFTAEGGRAFEDIEGVLEKMAEQHGQEWAKTQATILRSAKRYLKGDYKVHVSQETRVAEHCRKYALSDKDGHFRATCSHEHTDTCEACGNLHQIFDCLEESFTTFNFTSPEEQDEVRFIIDQARQDILAWQSHQLRSINQDAVWYSLLDSLDESSVLLVQDWAMKFLPRKFRESQTDWFGKRGISWHLTVAYRCVNAVIEAQTFVHLFQTCTQDSNTVVSVMKHTVEELKKDYPSLTSLYVRSDNAGCYHNVLTLQASKSISETTGVTVKRIDFCEPQGGKGSCDRQAATIKSHIKAWINEGHNVETADEFKAAVESHGGVPGVKVYRCEVNVDATVTSTKFEGITKLNNFEFTDAGLRVWRAFDIGEGKLIPWSKLPAVEPSTLLIISEPYNPGSAFRPVKSRRKKSQPQLETESDSEEETVSHETPAQTQVNIFPCPEEGCVKVYQTCRGLDAHVAVGRHNRRLERETLLDKAKLMYAAKLEKGPSEVPRLETASEGKRTTECPVEGWALRGPRKRVRFTAKQTAYLDRTFHLGERTGKKSDPQTVAKAMRHARDLQGQRLFGVNDFLTTQQVSSYFSRLAGKRQKPTEDDEVEQLDPAVLESINSKVQNEVMNNVHVRHPVLYDTYNLCDLAIRGDLYELGMPFLKQICEHFDIDVSSITDRRRKSAFVAKLQEYLSSCPCSK
uniref:C2H2-type domain-containing protein n=1 Tax=Branchiostoma floridae TaxID=7739 RepID=C3YRP4_BRAFL|eukprot:XP_002600787.1 hypothetical protein BRAFLDRAFT_95073 [Branchiostoma floridae]